MNVKTMKNTFAKTCISVALCATLGCSESKTETDSVVASEPKGEVAAATALEGFTTDYDGALKRAAERGVLTLVLFTGSDWCAWCQLLEEEVLSKKEFIAKAKDLYELVYCDFPQGKKLPKELAARNKLLSKKYNVESFPTVIVVDKAGNAVTKLGYREGGPEKWLEYATKEISIADVVAKYLKPFDDEYGKIDDEAFAAFEKGREAMKDETDMKKRAAIFDPIVAAPLAKAKDFASRLRAAEMPEELSERKADLIEAVDHVIFALENENR